jgi:hypothetical protein
MGDGRLPGVPGIVAALRMERRWIEDPETPVEVSGVGFRRAESAARRLLDRGATALVSWGVAGGLDPDLRVGTVVLPDAVVEPDGSYRKTDLEWRDRLLARVGGRVVTATSPLFHAVKVITEPADKLEIYRRTGAGAADMESAAVAAVAAEIGAPWIAVRVVVDAADVRLPDFALSLCEEGGRLKSSVFLWLVLRPGKWPGLFALARANAAAARSMRRVWSIAGPDLAHSGVQS